MRSARPRPSPKSSQSKAELHLVPLTPSSCSGLVYLIMQAVVSALANPNVSPALSPAAKAEYDAVQALSRNPALSLSPAISSGGRKLLMQ